ncbi:hypothetical protein NC652_025897 [Populus alba x Populus x berolinensis]|nr:hypothetical protein NC652_025897 [Populus alba x Populus x berolinensis]
MTRIKVICDPAGTSRYLGTKIKSSDESVCAGQRLAVQYLYGTKLLRELVPFTASVLLKASKNSDDGNDMEVLLSGVSSE